MNRRRHDRPDKSLALSGESGWLHPSAYTAARSPFNPQMDALDSEIVLLLRRFHDHGIFWPAQVAPLRCGRHITIDTVKRRLKRLGYAEACPTRDGYWRLTEVGIRCLNTHSHGGEDGASNATIPRIEPEAYSASSMTPAGTNTPNTKSPEMDPVDYSPGNWTNGEVRAAKALWDAHNPSWRVGQLCPAIEDAWMIYLPDARTCFNIFKSYA